MNIDLTRYVIAKWGPWLQEKDAFLPAELRLGSLQDGVTLAGPLRVCVSVQARNHFAVFGTSAVALQARDVYSYTLDIPPGQTWTYPAPQALPPPVLLSSAPAAAATLSTSSASSALSNAVDNREALWGANGGFGIAIRPAGADVCADPCRPVDPCQPGRRECSCGGGCGSGCGCQCHHHGDDLPCDFATGSGSQIGRFFPAACEPCAPGAFIGMPPVKGPALVVPPARGGTVRTRYFNGMFITKEDLWTDQNNNRIKHALMNRAMGQGVVWGLDVGLDGNGVCVSAGYGVDCCGNDIVISSAYRVDAEALVRDPAAAALLSQARSQRMNLLLEYFECPEEPRPVHGDPCGPESASCEMSRIRETGRLRLVPPCETDDSGPIKDFLDEVRRLRTDPAVSTLLTNSAATLAPAASSASALTPTVPFTILVEGLDQLGLVGSRTFQPHLPSDSPPVVIGEVAGTPDRSFMTGLRITIAAATDVSFVSGDAVREAPPGAITPTKTSKTIVWNDPFPPTGAAPPSLTYFFGNWSTSQAGGTLTSSGTRMTVNVVPAPTANLRMKLVVEIQPSPVNVSTTPPPLPCWAEACDPEGRLRFPVALPWLHADPLDPSAAADPKVLVLAILYALSVTRIVQSGPGVSNEVSRQQSAIANALNLAAARLLLGNVSANERLDLIEALRKLFLAWCKALLYPGPRCECGCDPHGVIIGCALVEGGRIRMVDPWGGRRWVVHYPLLAYWGKQFGLQPLDALASKFFDLICCVAHVYPARATTGLSTGTSGFTLANAPRAAVVPLGASVLIFDEPANVAGRLTELGFQPARTAIVSPTEFIALVVAAMQSQATGPVPSATLVHYTVTGLPDMHFVAPAKESVFSLSGSDAGRVPSVSDRPPTTRAVDMVRTTLAARSTRTAVPEPLTDVTATLTHELLGAIAPEPTTEAGGSVRDDLKAAGITTVAGLLNTHPADLPVDVLNHRNAAGLADLLNVSEKRVTSVTKAVADTMVKFTADRRIASPDDLARPAIAADFAKALGTALKSTVPANAVTSAVTRAARPVG